MGPILQYCGDHHDCKLICQRLGRISFSCRSILLYEVLFSFRSIVHSRHRCCICCFFLYQEYRSIVLFRQASNPLQNIVWTISGLRTFVRIFGRILSPSLHVAVHWPVFLQQQNQRNLRRFQMIRCFRFPEALNLRTVPCTDLVLLRRH